MIAGRKYWLKKIRAQWKPERSFPGWEKTRLIGLILPYMSAEEFEPIERWIDKQHHDARQIHILRLSPLRMTKKKESLREHNVLYVNETNWKGIPESTDFNGFISRKYDLVLQLCTADLKHLEVIPYQIRTGLLIGPIKEENEAYDVRFRIDGQPWTDVLEEIENWLKKIQYVS